MINQCSVSRLDCSSNAVFNCFYHNRLHGDHAPPPQDEGAEPDAGDGLTRTEARLFVFLMSCSDGQMLTDVAASTQMFYSMQKN